MTAFNPEAPAVKKLIANAANPWKFFFFALSRLPSLVYWGVRVQSLSPDRCVVTIPFRWRNQNPFRSMYFAAQCGAAELSTGLLGFVAIEGRGRISMLILNVEAEFIKKATQRTRFTCEDGDKIRAAVQKAIETGESQTVRVCSNGIQDDGVLVSRAYFTWSFKVKNP